MENLPSLCPDMGRSAQSPQKGSAVSAGDLPPGLNVERIHRRSLVLLLCCEFSEYDWATRIAQETGQEYGPVGLYGLLVGAAREALGPLLEAELTHRGAVPGAAVQMGFTMGRPPEDEGEAARIAAVRTMCAVGNGDYATAYALYSAVGLASEEGVAYVAEMILALHRVAAHGLTALGSEP
jgi:hypothetical protein